MRGPSLALGALTLAAALGAAPACAQSAAEEATRVELLRDAEQARRDGDHARALERAERAAQIRTTVSLRAFLARELSALGRDAEALGHLELCEREGPTERASRNRDAALEYCRAELPLVRARVARLVVEVPAGASPSDAGSDGGATGSAAVGLSVRLDGRALRPSFWNTPYVVAPGRHTVDAESDAGDRFHTALSLAAGATETVRVVLAPDPERLRAMRPSPAAVPLMIAGGGVAVAGAAAWVTAAVLYTALRGECEAPLGCSLDGAAGRITAIQVLDVTGPVLLGVGAGLAVVGAVLLVVTPRRGRAHARITPAGFAVAF